MVYMNSSSSLFLHLLPEASEPLHEQIGRQLRALVARGELDDGARLPPVRQLAREYRIPPSAVGAAYSRLIEEGLLRGDPSSEVVVCSVPPERRRELVETLQIEQLVAHELGRRELELARDVQRRLLPPSSVSGAGWQVAARCQPARVVAGDFYDVLRRTDGSVDLVVADVAGKGIGASLIMASVKAMLPFVTAEGDAADALIELNRRLAPDLGRGEFVALVLARYRPAERKVEIANAGAPDPYVIGGGDPAWPVSVPGPRLPLGVRDDVGYVARLIDLEEEKSLVMFSDGLPEARSATGEPIGYSALENLLARLPPSAPEAWLDELFERLMGRTEGLPDDDWTAALLVPGGRDAKEAGEVGGAQ